MALDTGALVSEAQLDLQQFEAQMGKLQTFIDTVNKQLGGIKDVTPKLDTAPLEVGSARAKGIAGSLQDALAKLSGGAVNLDTKQLESAGGVVTPVLKQMSEGFLNLGTVSASAGVGIAALAAGAAVALLKLGQEYEAGFRLITARTGESGEALKGLEESLTRLGQASPASIDKLANVLTIVHQRLGESGDEAERTTQSMLKYARATGGDAVAATQDLTRLFNAFHVGADGQRQALDALVAVSQRTGIAQDTLRQELLASGPVLRGYGLSLQESAGFLGILDKAGVNSQQVVFGLRKALGDLSGPDAKAQLLSLISDLGNATDVELANAKALDLFGPRAAAALLDAARSGKLSAETIAAAFEKSDDTVTTAAAATLSAAQRLEKAAEIAQRAWTPVAVAIAEAASAMVEGVVDGLSKAGHEIDAFLASDRARKLTEFLINLGKAATAPPPNAPEQPRFTAAAQALESQPIPGQDQFDAAALAAAGFTEKGLGQIADAFHRMTGGLTADEQALVDARRADIKAIEDWDAAIQAETEVTAAQTQAAADGKRILELAAEARERDAANADLQRQANENLFQGLLKVTNGQIDFNKALNASGVDTGRIQQVVELKTAWEELSKGIDELSNTQVKAIAIAAQHAAVNADGTVSLEKLAAASQFVNENLAMGAAIKEADAEATKKATAELDAITAAMEKAAKVADDEATRSFTNIAKTLSNDLDPATRQQVEQLLILGQTQQAAAIAGARFGLSEQDIARATEGTTRQIEEQIGRLKALADVSASAFVAGRPTQGSSNPFDQAVNQMQAGIQAAQQQYQQAQQALAQSAADSTTQFANAVATAQKSQADASTEFQRTYTNIANQRDVVNAQTEATIATATDKLASATRDLEAKRADLLKKFQEGVADAQAKFNESVLSAVEKNRETIGSLTAQINDAVSASLANSRAALLAFAQTMAGVISQSVQTANSDSIALAQLQAKQLAGGTEADQSALATQLTQLKAQQGFAAVAAQRQIDQARQGLVDAQNQSVGDVSKAQIKAQEDAKRATDELNKTLAEAAKTYQKTTDDLALQFAAQSKTLDRQAAEASTSALKAIQAAEDARAKQLKALEEQQRQAAEKRDKAINDAEAAIKKAEQDRTKRDAKLNEDQKKAEDTFLKARADAQKAVLEVLRKLPETMAEAVAQRLNLSPQNFAFNRVVAVETQTDFIDAATARLRTRVQNGV